MLNPETVESTGSADEEGSTILVHAKESLVNSLRNDTYKKGRNKTMNNESKSAGRKRFNSESSSSSSDVTDSKRRSKKGHNRKERNCTSDSDSVAELEWIPRDATGSYCELVGSTKSDIRKGYDINLVNPEKMQSAIGNSENRQNVYGPAVPPGESAKKMDDNAKDKIVTARNERHGSTSSSRTSSSLSTSSSSNRNRSSESSHKKGNQRRKTKRSSSPQRRKSIKSSKKAERIGDRSKSNETRKRERGELVRRSLSSRNQEQRRSRDRSTNKKSFAKRRDSRNSGIFTRTNGKKRESSNSSKEGGGKDRKRRSSRPRREHSPEPSRRTSLDHSGNKRRISNESQMSRSPSKKSGPSLVVNKSSDVKKMTATSAAVDINESGHANEQPTLSVTTEKKVDKSKETLEDMEAFLKQLKAQSKLKAIKK